MISPTAEGFDMETLADNSRPPAPGAAPRPGVPKPARARRTAPGSGATVLGSLTIPGRPDQVGVARAFVARTVGSMQAGADADEATLLTSEIVTNAIQHSKSGADGGTVTILVIAVTRGVLVEIIDDGSAGAPIVKGDLYAAEGHGLFLVQQLAAQWGYLRDSAGTTVWFHLPAAGEPRQATQQPSSDAGRSRERPGPPDLPGTEPSRPRPARPGQLSPPAPLRAAALPSSTAAARSGLGRTDPAAEDPPTAHHGRPASSLLVRFPHPAGPREPPGRISAWPRHRAPMGPGPG